jgi:hypothetical protein
VTPLQLAVAAVALLQLAAVPVTPLQLGSCSCGTVRAPEATHAAAVDEGRHRVSRAISCTVLGGHLRYQSGMANYNGLQSASVPFKIRIRIA